MNYSLELVLLPVTDVDRAKAFSGFADPDGNTWVLQERGFSG